jgi:hypothetical protein
MTYSKGTRVKHPSKADWGLGEVLEDSRGDLVRIFFVGVGEKTLSLKFVQPKLVPESEAAHSVLDNLKVGKSKGAIKYQSLEASKDYFLEQYVSGFYGERFTSEERDYKVHAHELAKELLDAGQLGSFLDSNDFDEICQRALKVANATNLIFPNEKMALKDGLVAPGSKQQFAVALNDVLHGTAPLQDRFNAFINVLEKIEADKWTTASYFLFITHPDKYMFVKPTVTQHAAELCGFEIYYTPRLNWNTYNLVLRFSEYLRKELKELEPRDYIDIQTFMWAIAPST